MEFESGGVMVHRPLLGVRKEELVDVCRANSVKWFEDHTNADVTLTMRNAVRSLLTDEIHLPKALRHERLLTVANKRAEKEFGSEEVAAKLLDKIDFSLRQETGQVTFKLDSEFAHQLAQDEDTALRVIRRILSLVSPKPAISLQDLDQALALVSGPDDGCDRPQYLTNHRDRAQVAGVQIQRQLRKDKRRNDQAFTAFRALPPAAEQKGLEMQLWPYKRDSLTGSSEETPGPEAWRVWDGRYWLRVQAPEHEVRKGVRVVVRLLNKDGLVKLRSMTGTADRGRADALDRVKAVEPYEARLTLPAIFVVRSDEGTRGEASSAAEKIAALPSLGWYAAGWTDGVTGSSDLQKLWRTEIRYKHVELSENQRRNCSV